MTSKKIYGLKNSFILASVLLFSMFMFTLPVSAASADTVCGGLNSAISGGNSSDNKDCNEVAAQSDINQTIKLALNILSFVAGIISVIMIIIGGLKYITSEGDPSKVASSQQSIIFSVIGIAIVALAQVIVKLMLKKVTSA